MIYKKDQYIIIRERIDFFGDSTGSEGEDERERGFGRVTRET